MSIQLFIRKYIFSKLLGLLSDKMYLEIVFPFRMGYRLSLKNPRTYSQKLQWLKLYDRKPEYVNMVDKCEAKKYASKVIGDNHIIPTLAVYNNVEDIDISALPDQFVLKCTHDSGGVCICKDKESFSINEAKTFLRESLKNNYFVWNREWPYKQVKPRIIAEKYMSDNTGSLTDYKFFCFDGVPKMMFIATDRFNKDAETKFDFYDMNFKHLPFINGHPNSTKELEKPRGFDEMKQLAAKLSQGIPHVRVDLYEVDGKIYFGEMTFYHWSGMVPFKPIEWDYKIGDYIKLPQNSKING